MNRLTVHNIIKHFGKRAVLDAVHFELQQGEILGIFGRNGCGKSTLLKILFGVQKADVFRMGVNGKALLQRQVIPDCIISYLPQESFLPTHLKVRDIIPMYFSGEGQDKIFNADGINKIANTPAGRLSMGEMRYFELLLIAHLPQPFLLLDEPFSMVEPLFKEKIKELLIKLTNKKGIIVTDHYYKDVLEVNDKSLLLKEGKLLAVSNVSDLAGHGYLP
ncbi:ATP-binding cassette domain-containing protein [Flavobacterium sp. RHBU_24]|uniref:ATP-binding cassette domain-containing protein n=1 Tax=Flavobacterium sp. RHBU_24 TaxID=3391185 RepID=UPI003984DA15